jgi:PKD repeat protein
VTKQVTVANLSPDADFTASAGSVEVGEEVRFTDGSSDPEGGDLDYVWDFGDGSSSSLRSPAHEYDEAGEYTVVLEVSDDEGASDSASVVVRVQEARRGIPGFPLESVLAALLVSFLLLRAWSGRA